MTASFDVVGSETPNLEIHGTAGSLTLGDPDRFNGAGRAIDRCGAETWEDVPLQFDGTVGRGVGLADFIDRAPDGRPARASGELAFHVLDVLLAIETAATTGAPQRVTSRCERPAPLD